MASIAAAQSIEAQGAEPESPLVPNNRWAVVIGVSNYSEEIGALKYTAKEAREFSSLLTNDLRFDTENVRLLADGGTPDEAPTSPHILSALDTLLADKRLDKANLFVFYFSGHGVGTATGDYLLPADAKRGQFETMGVPVKEVIARIVNAGLKNVVFIADACRAGTENPFGAELNTLCRKANIAVILGCSPGKRSYEYPSLKQGAFTHFLLESLRDQKLRDQSGTLWASAVGADVQKHVHDYTEVDYGKYAQVPALWGDGSTLDVLLATYPQPPVSNVAVQTFKKTVEKLAKRDYATALTSYAAALQSAARYDECVNLLKTVDQLGELTPEARLTLAASLDQIGRTGEAARAYDVLIAGPDGFWKDLAICSSPSRTLDPGQKAKAAIHLFETDPVWTDKMLAWQVVDTCGSFEDRLRVAREFAALPGKDERKHLFAVSQFADTEARWKDSIAALDKAPHAPGTEPSDDLLFISKLRPVFGLGDAASISGYVDEGIKSRANAGLFYLIKAQLAQKRGDQAGRVANIKLALTKNVSPNHLWMAIKIAGAHVEEVQKELQEAALKHPYSWRARLVVAFMRWVAGDVKGAQEDLSNTERYVDDALTYKSKVFEFADSMLSEELQLGKVPLPTYLAQVDFFFLSLKSYAAQFGSEADLWWKFIEYGMLNERTVQVNTVAAKFLTAEKAPKDLRSLLALLAMNRGDAATADSLFNGSFAPAERSDPAWVHAIYLVTRDQPEQAAKLIATLPSPSPDLATRAKALKTYLLAKSGKAAEARVGLTGISDDAIVDALNGLAWVELGDWKKAEPLLVEQVGKRAWAYLYVQEFAMRKLDAHYRATGQLERARSLALSAAVSQVGNPLFTRFTFAEKPGLAQFAGAGEMKALAMPDKVEGLTDVPGSLQFKVSATGDMTGAFIEDDGTKHTLQGKIDPLGNLLGTGDWNGHKLTLTGKIAPPPLYKTFDGFRTVGQILQLVNEDGFRIAILGQVAPMSGSGKS